MCLLLIGKIVHCAFICISFSFVHAPVCANCNYSCNCIFFKKKKKKGKKKKKQKKNDPYFGMGKNTKVMPQYPTIYLFLLGKGGNPYISKPYIKTKVQVHFLPCPQHEKIQIQTKRGQRTSKLPKNRYIFPMNFAPFQ